MNEPIKSDIPTVVNERIKSGILLCMFRKTEEEIFEVDILERDIYEMDTFEEDIFEGKMSEEDSFERDIF